MQIFFSLYSLQLWLAPSHTVLEPKIVDSYSDVWGNSTYVWTVNWPGELIWLVSKIYLLYLDFSRNFTAHCSLLHTCIVRFPASSPVLPRAPALLNSCDISCHPSFPHLYTLKCPILVTWQASSTRYNSFWCLYLPPKLVSLTSAPPCSTSTSLCFHCPIIHHLSLFLFLQIPFPGIQKLSTVVRAPCLVMAKYNALDEQTEFFRLPSHVFHFLPHFPIVGLDLFCSHFFFLTLLQQNSSSLSVALLFCSCTAPPLQLHF